MADSPWKAGGFALGLALLTITPSVALLGEPQQTDQTSAAQSSEVPSKNSQAMQFADNPDFKIAGVTDWTAAGGHGSDSILRTSEDLARETLALRPEGFSAGGAGASAEQEGKLRAALAATPGKFSANHQLGEYYLQVHSDREAIPWLQAAWQLDPANRQNEYDLAAAYEGAGNLAQARDHARKMLAQSDTADVHRLLGELDEQSGDPLAAVHEYEQAVHLDPSEQNYFEWGSELLLHRAVWQAAEVLRNGVAAHPRSARLWSALGAAQFAGDLFEQSAASVCAGSDLVPADPQPYSYLGRIEMASPRPLTCVLLRLQRFAQQQPESALANYLYAMAVLKRQQPPADPKAVQPAEALLRKAVTIDSRCGDAWLQLGNLAASRNDWQSAIDHYQKVIEVDPQSGEAYYRLGVAYDRSGKPDQAKQAFQRHEEIEKTTAANVERQRLGVKQFLVVLQRQQPNAESSH